MARHLGGVDRAARHARAAAGPARRGSRRARHPGHGRRGGPQLSRQGAHEDRVRGQRRAVRPTPPRPFGRSRRGRRPRSSAIRWSPNHPPAPGHARRSGSTATLQLEGWLQADPPGDRNPVLLEQMVVGAEHSFDSVLIDGELVWHSISRYLPTPLEVLENPWIQWAVLLPRDISGAGVRSDPQSTGCAGCARSDCAPGSPTWSGSGDPTATSPSVRSRRGRRARSSRRCCRTRTTSTCTRRGHASRSSASSRRRNAATRSAPRTCAVRAAARWSAIHGLDILQRELGDLVVEAQLPREGQPSSGTYEGEGHVILRHPETSVVEAGLAPRGRGCSRRAAEARRDQRRC